MKIAHLLMLALPLAAGTEPVEAQTPSSDTHPAMAEFASALRAATSSIGTGDFEELLSAARSFSKATQETAGLEPRANEDMRALFDRYLEDLTILSDDLVVQAQKKQSQRAVSALHEIRTTCVRCHTIFRPDIESNYPNRGNIIRGQVTIEKMDGDNRADRSNVVVFLDQASDRDLYRTDVTISQADRIFTPRVKAFAKGTTVKFPNDDTIFHNVFSLSKNKPFDLDIYSPGDSRSVTFDKPGWAKVYCNIHPNMVAHLIVLDNTFFAVSDARGNFVIPNLPDGDYSVRTWHEFASSQKKKVDVRGGVVREVHFQIREDKRLRAHKDKFGKPYKGKY